MDIKAIFKGNVTLEELYDLHDKRGVEFTIEDGRVTAIDI